jgi:nucleotide-binding universal stress UspA family protein
VPIDFDCSALHALMFAADFAKKNNASIHLVLFSQIVVNDDSLFNLNSNVSSLDKGKFNAYIQELSSSERMKGVDLESSMVYVKNLWDILSMDKYRDVDLIVLGTTEDYGVKEFFIGTNAQKFIQIAEPPVLVLKKELKLNEVGSIVFASDFGRGVAKRFKIIKNLTDFIGAKLHLLRVMTPKDYSAEKKVLKSLSRFVKEAGLEEESISIYQSVSKERGVLDYCNEINAGMLVLETYQRVGLGHLVHSDLAENIVNSTRLPLLSVRVQKANIGLIGLLADFLNKTNRIAEMTKYKIAYIEEQKEPNMPSKKALQN